MKRFAIIAAAAMLGLSAQASWGYSKVATVTVNFGGNAAGASPNVTGKASDGGAGTTTIPYSASADIGWTASGVNTLAVLSNSTYFNALNGYNSIAYYNQDFATQAQCNTIVASQVPSTNPGDPIPDPTSTAVTRKYACRFSATDGTALQLATPVVDDAPVGQATGTLTVTDTTITGTLTIINSSDEPTGATITLNTVVTPNVRTSTSIGNGVAGYNYRSADGSPFGNSWYGVTTAGTYAVNLTGTFTATTWDITGGSVTFSDPGFACAQGGFGGTTAGAPGTLCTPSSTGGGFQPNGANLSWGIDIDGIGTGATTATPIVVKESTGTTVLDTLSGVLASLAVDGSGNITTVTGEFRKGLGSAAGNCFNHVRYDGTKMSCGSITTGALDITGTASDPDTDPDAFAFTDQTNVATSALITSNAVTIAGINTAAPISVTGGAYSIGCTATFVSTAGTINSGQTVCVQQTSSATPSTPTDAVLTIGTVADTFTVTTSAQDLDPDPFTFTDQTGVAVSTVTTSNTVTITGIDAPAAISVSAGGAYSIGCTATFTSTASTITTGQTVCVRQTSSATPATSTDVVLTVGGGSDTFTVTTVPADTTPVQFTFTDQTDVAVSTLITSNTVTITGINAPAAISVTGGAYSIGCTATFVSTAGTIANGETVCVQQTSSAMLATATNTALTIGGVSDTFTVTTVPPDTTPNAFTFTDQTVVALSAVITSNTVTIGGLGSPAAISVTGGTYSIGCTATFVSTAGTIANGETVCVRHTSAATEGTSTDTVLTIGGVSDTFRSTTLGSAGLPGGNSSMDEFAISLLGLVALLRRGRRSVR